MGKVIKLFFPTFAHLTKLAVCLSLSLSLLLRSPSFLWAGHTWVCFVCVCVCWHSRTTLELSLYKNKLVHLTWVCVRVCVSYTCICRVQWTKKRTIGAKKKKNAWHAICINFFICLNNNAEKNTNTHSLWTETEMDAARSTHTRCVCLCVCCR